jgi:hypothetical protein
MQGCSEFIRSYHKDAMTWSARPADGTVVTAHHFINKSEPDLELHSV